MSVATKRRIKSTIAALAAAGVALAVAGCGSDDLRNPGAAYAWASDMADVRDRAIEVDIAECVGYEGFGFEGESLDRGAALCFSRKAPDVHRLADDLTAVGRQGLNLVGVVPAACTQFNRRTIEYGQLYKSLAVEMAKGADSSRSIDAIRKSNDAVFDLSDRADVMDTRWYKLGNLCTEAVG